MRCLDRNKVKLHYALLNTKNEIRDEYGNVTGEYELKYGAPIRIRVNVSAARGETQTRQFGEAEEYDKVVVTDDPLCPIDEYAVLWIDTDPNVDGNGNPANPHDYVVKKVARSLNIASYAVEKVKVQ